MTSKVTKSTERGQITLPKKWRGRFNTDDYILEMYNNRLVIIPIDLKCAEEELIFDADRDNKGKGINTKRMITALKKIQHG